MRIRHRKKTKIDDMCDCQVTVHNELKRGKNPFWQANALFAAKAKINVFEIFSSGRGP